MFIEEIKVEMKSIIKVIKSLNVQFSLGQHSEQINHWNHYNKMLGYKLFQDIFKKMKIIESNYKTDFAIFSLNKSNEFISYF